MSEPQLKTASFGGCTVNRFSPADVAGRVKVVNAILSFEEALKLKTAIEACVLQLNSYHRATTDGKRAGMCIALHVDKDRITITEQNTSL